tara:strand:+ start:571 stop:858 length:288 start_codon:yes stop_codon:yes gene_type:complete
MAQNMRQSVIEIINQRIVELNETNSQLSGQSRNKLLTLKNKLKLLKLKNGHHSKRAQVVKIMGELRDVRLYPKGPKVFENNSFPVGVVSAIMEEG